MLSLKRKIGLVTGAASGIGEGVAKKFAQEGAEVILADQNAAGLERVKREIRDAGGSCIARQLDVRNPDAIAGLFRDISAEYGRLHILNTNTWWAPFRNVERTSLADWNRTMEVTLTAPFLFSKQAIPLMRQSGGGSIIHTSSVGGLVAFRNHAAYMAAKAAVIHLCKSIAVDFGAERIRCNALCPGIIQTPATQRDIDDPAKHEYFMRKSLLQRIGTPEDVAAAAVFLAGDESEFVTGIALPIDSGWGII